MAANPNDPLRLEILKYLYERHLKHDGTHRHETQGDHVSNGVRKITDAPLHEIAANMNYLVSTGFVNHRREPMQLPDGRTIDGKHVYSISGAGINRIEGGSEFQVPPIPTGMTVSNTVVTVGSANIVMVGGNVSVILSQLAETIKADPNIAEEVKRDALGDLETVRAQASKSKPDAGIIKTAWEGVKIAVTAKEAIALLKEAAALLGL